MHYNYDQFGIKNVIFNSTFRPTFKTFLLMNMYGCVRFCVNMDYTPNTFRDFLGILSDLEIDKDGFPTYKLKGEYVYKDYKDKFSKFLEQNAKKDPEQIGLIGKWKKWMKPDEVFLFLPYINDDAVNKCKIYLMEKNLKNFKDNRSYVEEYIKEIKSNYTITVFDERNQPIGESDPEKRICLFCGKSGKELFKQKAHAISESLGNKALVQNEECDECNHAFGTSFEQDFANYLSLFRAMYSVKGKNGTPHIKDIAYHSNDAFCIKGSIIEHIKGAITYKIDPAQDICPQNLYKSLVLYAISLIGNNNKDSLKKTIEWLNGKAEIQQLPMVSCSIQLGLWREHPWAICYVRSTDDKSLPKIVIEFHFLFLVYIAIIPLNSEDDRDFTNVDDYRHFWNSFPHFRNSFGWTQYDWSSKEKQPLSYILHLKPRK